MRRARMIEATAVTFMTPTAPLEQHTANRTIITVINQIHLAVPMSQAKARPGRSKDQSLTLLRLKTSRACGEFINVKAGASGRHSQVQLLEPSFRLLLDTFFAWC